MKSLFVTYVLLFALTGVACADDYVNGYYKNNGTYVQPYTRSAPDNSYNNNYNVQGNYNPSTGQQGTDHRTYNDRTPEYNQKTYGNSEYEPTPAYNYNTNNNSNTYRKRY